MIAFGVGYDPGGNPTGEITGTVDGQSISMLYNREDYGSDYTIKFEGMIYDCNSMSGTWRDYARTDEHVVYVSLIVTTKQVIKGDRRSSVLTTHGARISTMVIRTTTASSLRAGPVLFGLFNYLTI